MDIPVESFNVRVGAYGSIGSFDVRTSIKELASNKIDLYQMIANESTTDQNPSLSVVIFSSVDNGSTWTKLFFGDLDSVQYEFDKDTVNIKGRDLAGRLTDTNIVLKGSQYVNKTPLQIAQEFASDAGLTFVGPVGGATPAESNLGYQYLKDVTAKSMTPISRWALLVQLARNVGYQVYTTPNGELVFAPPDQSQSPLVYTWLADPTNASLVPVKELSISYNPRRNRTFQVLMLSYHPKSTQFVWGNTVVLGQSVPSFTSKTVPQGFWRGAAGQSIRAQAGAHLEGKPVYLFYVEGMTAQQCQEKSEAIAKEISQRQFTVTAVVIGDSRLRANIPIKFDGPLSDFQGTKLMTSSVEHTFSLKEGFLSHITAMFIPPEPQALSVDPFG